ncbi:MAG: ThuA domain-containing protein [Saprospiraceae bacterium]
MSYHPAYTRKYQPPFSWLYLLFLLFFSSCLTKKAVVQEPFKVISFYTAKNDRAHISFVNEANKWFAEKSTEFGFSYQATDNWDELNAEFLAQFQVVIFLDTRPEVPDQRSAFENYMKTGGAWMGFHFAAFALTPSAYPNNWEWYHDEFLGCGEYKSNTWRPTAALLKVENKDHPANRNLPEIIQSAPNEWYRWEKDLRDNPDIDILLSIDPASFPLGTGPKPHEIWHSGYYPVVWTNKRYHMIYFNMGHNDIDYENGTNEELSFTFHNTEQDRLILNALMWLGTNKNGIK